MRVVCLVAALLLVACTEPAPSSTAASRTQSTETTLRPSCKLPVYWGVDVASPPGTDVHAAFVSMPDGAVSEVGVLPGLPQVYGATYEAASNKWLRVDRELISPDGTRYAYWIGSPSKYEVHVVDVASGADRVVYTGSTLYIVIAFQPDGIYLVHGINPRQGAYEKLYRLDPAGGIPVLVPGSDHHMYQWGWVLISDGAAWGIDYRVLGNAYIYSVLRLDLASSQVTQWFEGPADDLVWPLGTDSQHNLYVQGVNALDVKHGQLWRLGAAGQAAPLANPGPISLGDSIGSPSVFVSDSVGAWFAGQGGVWLYSANGEPKQFVVGPPDGEVAPAGPCL